ncbi:MAG: EAL domain-containing protein, partial [Lachnospiraceae bacterium]
MNNMSSGTYMIDSEYNITYFNEVAAQLYPMLEIGKKCYKALMNLEEPCEVCPVLNKVKGPRTYLDPIRHVYETVDAVDLPASDGTMGHALIFSTVGESERLSDNLPTHDDGLRLLNLINMLSTDISNLYTMDRYTHKVTTYRNDGKIFGGIEELLMNYPYEKAMEIYINYNVHPSDKETMLRMTKFSFLEKELMKREYFVVKYRVLHDNKIYHFEMKYTRMGNKEDFDTIIIAFVNTDNSFETMKIMESLRPGSLARHRTILVVEDNELNREILVEFLKDDYDVLEAADGEEALSILKKHYSRISVILLDLIMPKLTGYEFMEKIKTNIYFSAIPIIVMTGSVDKSEEEHCLELGAIDFIPKPYKPAIVKSRIHNIIRMRETVASLNVIEIDDLTGLYTKQAFFHHAQTLLDTQSENSYDIILTDIQNFKLINSIYGVEKADRLLQNLGEYMKSHIKNGICARYGSDQFIGIFKSINDKKKKWLIDMIAEFESQAPIANIVVKCGLYEKVDRTLTITNMCDRALLALKSIKHNNDRLYALYDGPVSQRQLRAQQYELHFREAIEKKEFIIWYQPKYDSHTEKVVGAEALVRWRRKDGHINPPADFLSVFEEDGLIGQLDEYVFRAVCEYQKKWMENGKELIPISINLSRNSMHQSDLVKRYKKITEEYGISPSLVPIEITESAAVESLEIKPLADEFYKAGFS